MESQGSTSGTSRARVWSGRTRRTGFWLGTIGTIAVVAGLAGCESLTLRREPETARIKIESTDVSQVTLITSQRFIQVEDEECGPQCPKEVQLLVADTADVSLPFERTYSLNSRLQFFAETFPVVREEAELSMLAHVDDREWFNSSRTLQPEDEDGLQETLRFVYQYSRASLPN